MWAYLWAVVLTMIKAEMTRQLGRIILGGKVIPSAIQPSATAGDVLTTTVVSGKNVATWAAGGGGGGSEGTDPSFSANLLTSVTMTNANQYYAGPSLSLPAGTVLITGTATISNPGAAADVLLKIWDGASTVAKMARQSVPAGGYATVTLDALITLSSPATYTLAADGAVAGMVLIATVTDTDTSTSNPATYLVAITEEHA